MTHDMLHGRAAKGNIAPGTAASIAIRHPQSAIRPRQARRDRRWAAETLEGRLLLSGRVGGELVVSLPAAYDQWRPAVAVDGGGRSVVAWESATDGPVSRDVLARCYDAEGVPQGDPFLVHATPEGDQGSAGVAMDYAGRFVVVWVSDSPATNSDDILARRFSPEGLPLGGEFRVNTFATGLQDMPAIAMNRTGSFVVTWYGRTTDGRGHVIYAQRYDSSGAPVGGEFAASTDTLHRKAFPSVAIDDAGGFVIAWEDRDQDGSGDGVYAQRFGPAGDRRGAEFRVNSTTLNGQASPSVAAGGSGNFLIAWFGTGSDPYKTIYAQRYGTDGVPIGAEFPVEDADLAGNVGPSATMDEQGAFVISWISVAGVFAKEFSPSGAPLGSEFPVKSTSGYQANAVMPARNYGQYVVAWDRRDANVVPPYTVHAQLFSRRAPSSVVGRHAFYDNSAFDGGTAGDDGAIATQTVALRPGAAAAASNLLSYSRGINGIMIDILGLPTATAPSATDFELQMRRGATWVTATAPTVFTRRGRGDEGSDRVTLVLPDGAVTNTWLRITVKATANTGLVSPDVFYFGNLVGDTVNDRGTPIVNATDLARTRAAVFKTDAASLNRYDFNRDGRIDASDVLIVRNNQRHSLPLFTAPVSAPAAPAVLSHAAVSASPRAPTRPPRRSVLDAAEPGLLV